LFFIQINGILRIAYNKKGELICFLDKNKMVYVDSQLNYIENGMVVSQTNSAQIFDSCSFVENNIKFSLITTSKTERVLILHDVDNFITVTFVNNNFSSIQINNIYASKDELFTI